MEYVQQQATLNDSLEHGFSDIVIDLDEVHSLISEKIDRTLGALLAVHDDALLGPNGRVAVRDEARNEESWPNSVPRFDLGTKMVAPWVK